MYTTYLQDESDAVHPFDNVQHPLLFDFLIGKLSKLSLSNFLIIIGLPKDQTFPSLNPARKEFA